MTCGKLDFGCTRCRLSLRRTKVVAGVGSCSSPVAFIGEAPGGEEDLKGEPFVGRAGRLLDDALRGCGTSRDQVFVTNLVKCRPPGNRRPRRDEVGACFEHLQSELEAVAPSVVCVLGQSAAKHLLGETRNMSELVGEERELVVAGRKVRVFVAYHPAACLYRRANLESFRATVKASLRAAGLA